MSGSLQLPHRSARGNRDVAKGAAPSATQKELMEELYEDNNVKADCKVVEEYMDNYNQTSEPLFTDTL